MKTIKITLVLLMIGSYAYAQDTVRMVKTTDELEFVHLQEESNFRTNSPLLHLDGTPYPAWHEFGFEPIDGLEPTYRAIGEVLDTDQIVNLVRSRIEIYVDSIFNLAGNVLEVAFCFGNDDECAQIREYITDQEFYRIAQNMKQYDKYRITSDNTDVQWLGASCPIDFIEVLRWKLIHSQE